MNNSRRVALSTLFALTFVTFAPSIAQAQWPQFSGQVYAIRGKAEYFVYNLVSTGVLYSGGEEVTREQALVLVENPGTLRAEFLQSRTGGAHGTRSVMSESSLANLNFFVGGNRITASVLKSRASGRCAVPGGPVLDPSSAEITTLVINGIPITVTGQPNQVVAIPNGRVILNERQALIAGNTAMSTVTAMHVILNAVLPGGQPLADMKFASSEAYTVCECPGTIYAAEAAAANTNISNSQASLLQTFRIDGGAFAEQKSIGAAQIQNVLTITGASTSVAAGNTKSEANAQISNINVSTSGVSLTAGTIAAVARKQCGVPGSGAPTIVDLRLNGTPIQVTGQPNQVLIDGPVKLVINEQRNLSTTGFSVVGVRLLIFADATHARLIGDAELAVARAMVTCGC